MLAVILAFFSWPVLLCIAVLVAIAVLIAVAPPPLGPARLLQIALDSRTWIIIAGLLFGISYYHNAQVIQKQATQINTDEQASTAGGDSAAVVTDDVKKKQKRTVQTQQQQATITAAPEGDKVDALMDEIAKENENAQ
jgi:hypothetical protein